MLHKIELACFGLMFLFGAYWCALNGFLFAEDLLKHLVAP